MRRLLPLVMVLPAAADDLQVTSMKQMSAEECLARDGKCPTIGGRWIDLGRHRMAIVDELGTEPDTLLCEYDHRWECRPLRLTSARGKAATARELLDRIVSEDHVGIGDAFGTLVPAQGRPRSCGEQPSLSCAVQPAKLFTGRPGDKRERRLYRQMWLVEQDEQLLLCSDEELRACDRLTAASWLAIAMGLRPAPSSPPLPAPEAGTVEQRRGRPGALAEGGPAAFGDGAAASDAGAIVLPDRPDAIKVQARVGDLRKAARHCLPKKDQVEVVLTFDGEGHVLGVVPDDGHDATRDCLDKAAAKLEFPHSRQNLNTIGVTIVHD